MKEKKKHGFIWNFFKVILIILFLVVLFVGGFLGYSVYKNGWGVKGIVQTVVGSDTPAEELDEFQVLILGISEDIDVELTDTIIVASYNPQTQKAVLLSIPRDTFVGTSKQRANSYDKINAIYQVKGAEGVLEKVNNLTGLNLKKYIVVSNNALVELVDEIGGVEFDVPMDMNYDSKRQNLHIHLKKGLQKLDGEQAEWLVRFRKNNNGTTYSPEYGNDDYGRMKTQRDFLKAVAKQTLQAKNITKVGALIDIVKKNVKTNITDWEEVKDYIPYAVEFDTANIETANIPGESARLPAGTGLWFFLADETETEEKVNELFANQNSKEGEGRIVSKSKINIEILDGSGNSKNLTKVTNALKEKGYKIYKTGTTSTTSKTVIIDKLDLSSEITSDIKETIGTGILQSSSPEEDKIDMTIIIGTDFDE